MTLCAGNILAQATYNMSNNSVTDCEARHRDSDGQFGGRYTPSENFTFTICPGDPNAQIIYTFTQFALDDANDVITFYDGPNTGSPVIVSYNGTFAGIPPSVIANNGCLTITFVSDAGPVFGSGWDANWTTVAPEPVEPVMTTSISSPPTCGSNTFQVSFDSPVRCDSIFTSAFSFNGINAPAITSVVPGTCTNDSTTFATITLASPLNYNCEYAINFSLNATDICDSSFSYFLTDTFNFNTCPLLTTVTPDQTICIGNSINISASVFPGCNSYTYSWNNGLPATAGPHNVSPTTFTQYIVNIIEVETGVSFTDTIDIGVSDTISSALDFTFSTGNAPQCDDSSFNIVFSPALVCSFLDSGVFTLSSSGGSTPSVIAATALNCTGNAIDSVRIDLSSPLVSNCDYQLDYDLNFSDPCNGIVSTSINDTFSLSTCAFTATVSYPDTICIGNCDNVTVTANGCSSFTYAWSNGLPPTPGPHSICPNGDTTFTVTITENGSGLVIIDTISIEAYPQGITLDMNMDPVIPVCFDNTVVVDFSPSVNIGALTPGNFTIVGGPQTPTVTGITPLIGGGGEPVSAIISLDTSFNYNCDYEVVFNIDTLDQCGQLLSLQYRDTFRVVDCELPDTVTHSDTICGGDCTSIVVNEISTCFGLQYVWSNGLPNSPGPHTICPTSDTTFTVIITEDTTGKVTYDTVNIVVNNQIANHELYIDSAKGLPGCDSTNIYVRFTENVHCDSILPSLFSINFTTGDSIVSATPTNWIGDSATEVTIVISGTFQGNCPYTIDYLINVPGCSRTLTANFEITDCEFQSSLSAPDTICFGNSGTVTYNTNSCYPIAYTWSNGLPAFGGPHTITPTGDTVFYVTITESVTGNVIQDTIDIKFVDTEIDPVPNLCVYDAPYNLVSGDPGGVWAGPGITDTALGIFDPSVSGPGLHGISYTLFGCPSSIGIIVTNPSAGPNRNTCNSGIPFNLTGSPGGGTWSGPHITSGGSFTPTDYGTFTVYYTVNGCIDSTEVFVDSLVLTYDSTLVCRNDAPFNIPISPTGGTWSGTGITDVNLGTFDPSIANAGFNTVTYSYLSCTQNIVIDVQDVYAGLDTVVCPQQPQFNLPAGNPPGGTWAGVGITNSMTGLYDPAIKGNNSIDTVTYQVNGCYDTLYIDVIQTDIAVDTLPFCLNEPPIQLIGSAGNPITPPGGDWTGNGVSQIGSDYYFYPDSAGVGVHTLIYDQNTCSDSIVMVVYPDTLSFNTMTICDIFGTFEVDPAFNLPQAYWSGPGIIDSINGTFDPTVANVGSNIINYINPAFQCIDSLEIIVYPYVDVEIIFPDSICYSVNDSMIPVNVSGGTWSGTGTYDMTNGIFNPALAGQNSTNEFIYTFGVAQCQTIDTHYVYVRDSISGNLIASDNNLCPGETTTLTAIGTGGFPTPNYTYTWSHTANTNNVLNENPPVTTTFTVSIGDGCSDPREESITIDVSPKPISTLETNPIVCFGEEGYVTFDTNQTGHTYTWLSPPAIGDTVFANTPNTISVRITNSFGCFFDTTLILPNYPEIIASFNRTPELPEGVCLTFMDPKVGLSDQSIGGVSGSWDLGEAMFTYDPDGTVNYTYEEGGSYQIILSIKNDGPCFDTARDSICVIEEPIFVPDIFSPNNDGQNDILYVRGQQVDKLEFHVFDRWGQKMFMTRDFSLGWDGTFNGKQANAGVYVYYVSALLESGDIYELKGDVTLIR